jgi:hypothetical protein
MALLTGYLLLGADIVLRVYCHVVSALLKIIGNIKLERNIAAAMLAYLSSVYVNGGSIVAGIDVEYYSLALPLCGDVKISAIPNGVDKIGVAYARQNALGRKGDGYLALKAVSLKEFLENTGATVIHLEIPSTVQVYPRVSSSVGTGMLTSRNSVVHFVVLTLF